ncbi:MAG: ParB/RepB/Spo0J family partition protein [Deltaproteobacteria bacterium]|nr:ParB/RepB/Spo0J family partition protein [Deltaproteobacteria bacterium]
MADMKKRGLGRGLDALMPGSSAASRPTSIEAAVPSAPALSRAELIAKRTFFQAGIEDVYPGPEQPRRKFDETKLGELADTIRVHGIIVPLIVRPRADGGYFLIAGERRWRAAQRAGLHEVPVVVQDVTETTALERALVENLQRADLGPLEEAAAYQRLVDEYKLSHDDIAERVGKDRSTIANAIRLLKLPPSTRQLVEDDRLSMGHARALLGLEDTAAIERAARQVVDKQLSVRATEALVKKARTPKSDEDRRPPSGKLAKSASVRDLEERLTRSLGGPVTITEDEPGKAGHVAIRYMDLDHLERLLDRLL